jgi:hypothetical protein
MPKPYFYNRKSAPKKQKEYDHDPIIDIAPSTNTTIHNNIIVPTQLDLSPSEKNKLIMANAIKSISPSTDIVVYTYPIIPEYSNKLIYNCITDFAEYILKEYPYNNSSTPLDIDILSQDASNAYLNHLTLYFNVDQHGLNNLWIPNGKAWFPKGLKCSAKIDIAVISDNKIKELWFITDLTDTLSSRTTGVIAAGYNVPIYHIKSSLINSFKTQTPEQLYINAKKNATILNSTGISNNVSLDYISFDVANDTTESNSHFNAKLILANNIKNTISCIPYVEYAIFNNYGVMPLNTMITDFAPKILKIKPFNGSTTPPDINKLSDDELQLYVSHLKLAFNSNQYGLNDHWVPGKFIHNIYLNRLIAIADIAINDGDIISELWEIKYTHPVKQEKIDKIKANGFDHIPIYEIDADWIITNKDNDNLYELAKEHARRWN